jgi:hypothetical protein
MMRWRLAKPVWEKCRVTTSIFKHGVGVAGVATCLFLTVGTTVPENVYRHIYGIVAANRCATLNNFSIYHLPDGGKGTQYLIRQAALSDRRSSPTGNLDGGKLVYPDDPNPLAPILALEGGSKLYGVGATASLSISVLYWDDVLTGIESA